MTYVIRIENLLLLVLSLFTYFYLYQFSWVILLVCLFVPDLSMVGYLHSSRLGALIYNIAHTLILPTSLFLAGWLLHENSLTLFSLIFYIHIFMDRVLGYGLKSTDGFQHTHLF